MNEDRIAALWRLRSRAELQAAGTFRVLADRLRADGADPQIVDAALRAIEDETRHAELCWSHAKRFSDDGAPIPLISTIRVPPFLEAPENIRTTLLVMLQCCFNESTACAYLEASLAAARDEDSRRVVRELLRDEADHARLGWAYVSSRMVQRQVIQPFLPTLLVMNVEEWSRAAAATREHGEFPQHGCLGGDDILAALRQSIRDVQIPGLAHVGFVTAESELRLSMGIL